MNPFAWFNNTCDIQQIHNLLRLGQETAVESAKVIPLCCTLSFFPSTMEYEDPHLHTHSVSTVQPGNWKTSWILQSAPDPSQCEQKLFPSIPLRASYWGSVSKSAILVFFSLELRKPSKSFPCDIPWFPGVQLNTESQDGNYLGPSRRIPSQGFPISRVTHPYLLKLTARTEKPAMVQDTLL